ncbi:retinitis pigmentosa GTPase regulator b [Aplochiton taeniatus]
MAGEAEDEIPESGAVFTFGKSKFADNIPSKFWLKNDVPLKIACGDEHTALITENGKLFMFGSNNWGQLGLGSKATVNKPTCVKALKSEKVQLVACGRNHTIVYTSRGNVYATGGNNEGQLGLGDCEERTTFQLVEFFSSHGPIKMLAAGSNTSAALTESGKLFMWGDNTEGQIGLGKASNSSTPQEVIVGQSVAWVSCGYYHSAFVTAGGGLYTFGESDSGKLGLGTDQMAGHRVPQRVKSVTERVKQVACGGGHTVALTEDDVLTFGLGQFGQLGHGTFSFEARLPQPVDHFRKGRVRHVACGENHTAVITEAGLLYTFGDGRHGKLGLGEENFTNQFKPTLCPRFLNYNVQDVTCGGCHMLVLARPRDESCGQVTLEDSDVTADQLEKSYAEMLGGDASSSDTLLRSLSARVRRRERERSPEQFGLMFRTLPPLTSGYLNPPLALPVSSQTIPPRLPPAELVHRKVHNNGVHQHRSAGSHQQEKGSVEADGDQRVNVVESITDTESVKDLGDTTDFLNMTHVMKMDPSDNSLTLSPVHKRKGKHGKTGEGARDKGSRNVEPKHQTKKGLASDSAASPRRALPTELLRNPSDARSFVAQSPRRKNPPLVGTRGKENILRDETPAVKPKAGSAKARPPSLENLTKATSKPRVSAQEKRGEGGKRLLMEVEREDTEVKGEKEFKAREVKDSALGQGSKKVKKTLAEVSPKTTTGGKNSAKLESKPRLKGQPIVVQSQPADVRSSPHRKSPSGGQETKKETVDGGKASHLKSTQPPSEGNAGSLKTTNPKEAKAAFKNSKNSGKEKKESDDWSESTSSQEPKDESTSEQHTQKRSLLTEVTAFVAGAAAMEAGRRIVKEVASVSRISSQDSSKSFLGMAKESPAHAPPSWSDPESQISSPKAGTRTAVSINVVAAPESLEQDDSSSYGGPTNQGQTFEEERELMEPRGEETENSEELTTTKQRYVH